MRSAATTAGRDNFSASADRGSVVGLETLVVNSLLKSSLIPNSVLNTKQRINILIHPAANLGILMYYLPGFYPAIMSQLRGDNEVKGGGG